MASSNESCPVCRTAEIVCGKWTLLVIRDLAEERQTSHPGSRETSFMVHGDHVADATLPGAATVAHWFLISGVDVRETARGAAIVTLGEGYQRRGTGQGYQRQAARGSQLEPEDPTEPGSKPTRRRLGRRLPMRQPPFRWRPAATIRCRPFPWMPGPIVAVQGPAKIENKWDIWNLQTMKKLGSIEGSSGSDLAISPDGTYVATTAYDAQAG